MRSMEITWVNTIKLPEMTGKWLTLTIAIFKLRENSDGTWVENEWSRLPLKATLLSQPQADGDKRDV